MANDAPSTNIINGNTNITIDLSNYSGNVTSFEKQIIGGHVNKYKPLTAKVNGNTNINITGKSGITFAKDIVGGSLINRDSTATQTGASNINISGGSTFSGKIIGGSYTTGGNVTHASSNLTLNGGSYNGMVVGGSYAGGSVSNLTHGDVSLNLGVYVNQNVIGANYANDAVTQMTAGDVTINVTKDGHSYWNLVGGHYFDSDSNTQISGTVGNITINLDGGTIKDTYGGSWVKYQNASSTISQGNISINLKKGTLNGDIYAAGRQAGASKMTTQSTTVSLDSDVTLEKTYAIISGGYKFENATSGSEVTGDRTLIFTGSTQDRSSITFKDFDVIKVEESEAVVTVGSLSLVSLTKSGKGTLTLSADNSYSGGTIVEAGKLVAASAGALGSGTVTVNQGATLELQAMPTDWTATSLLSGKVEGTGNLLISVSGCTTGNATLTTTFSGTLELADDVTFTLGATEAGNDADKVKIDTSSLSGVVLNNASVLQYQGSGENAIFKNLKVNSTAVNGATLDIVDTTEDHTIQLTGVTTLNNNLKITSQYGGKLSIEQLAGSGTLTSIGSTVNAESFTTTIDSLDGFSGNLHFQDAEHTVEVNTGSGDYTVEMGELVDSGVMSFTFNVETDTTVNKLTTSRGSVSISEGKTLTLGGGTDETPVKHSIGSVTGGSGSKLQLDEFAELTKVTRVQGELTLSGKGVYNYGEADGGFALGFSLDADNWFGTVALAGGDRGVSLTTLEGASTKNSMLMLTGYKGYLDGTSEMKNNLVLINGDAGYGILLDNGTSDQDPRITFSGNIEGKGHIVYAWANNEVENGESTSTATHVFTGDTSDWEGMFIRDLSLSESGRVYGKYVVAEFTAGGHVFSAEGTGGVKDNENSGKLSVVIDAKKDTYFHGSIENVGGVTVNSNTDFMQRVDTAELIVAKDATASVGGSNTLQAGEVAFCKEGATLSNVTVRGNSITATSSSNGAVGSIANALVELGLPEMAAGTRFTIEDMMLSNVELRAKTSETRVYLNNVSGSAILSTGTFVLDAKVQKATSSVGEGGMDFSLAYGAEGTPSLTLNAGSMVLLTADPTLDVNGAFGTYTLTFTLDVNLGAGFTEGSIDWSSLVGFDGWLGSMLATQMPEMPDVGEMPAELSQEAGPSVSYNYTAGEGSNVGSLVITINGLNVPEPATSTLSLIALAALAARRRRKG